MVWWRRFAILPHWLLELGKGIAEFDIVESSIYSLETKKHNAFECNLSTVTFRSTLPPTVVEVPYVIASIEDRDLPFLPNIAMFLNWKVGLRRYLTLHLRSDVSSVNN